MITKLNELLDVILLVSRAIKSWLIRSKKEELKDAAKKAVEDGDQRDLENALGGSGVSTADYDGMYKRPRDKKE